jgi:RNA polymerase sigma-70 factor, ECF subfamily
MAFTDDVDLIRRFKDGDRSAFEAIVLHYQDRIYNLCLYMLKDTEDAREAAQDAFIKAYRNLKDFQPRAALYTWLYRITVNTCLDYRRKTPVEAFRGDDVLGALASNEPSPERLTESRETADAIQRALQELSKELRVAIVLREIEGLSYEEIAEVLRISVGTVKSRIARAREALRTLLRGRV